MDDPGGRDTHSRGARALIDDHESSLSEKERRETGAHYTPAALAEFLSATALDSVTERLGRLPERLCDPSCGAGSFLLAVAEEMVRRGADPVDVVANRITGFDVDVAALEVASAALVSWAQMRTGAKLPDLEPDLRPADVLDSGPNGAASILLDAGPFDLVIGNPPFLTQLRSATVLHRDRLARLSEHFSGLDPYVDASALFLVLAAQATTPGGVTCMIQPQSFLSVKGAQGVRDRIVETCDLLSVWSSSAQFFDASVRVCAVTLSRRVASPTKADGAESEHSSGHRCTVMWGGGPSVISPEISSEEAPAVGQRWGYLIAAAMGIPALRLSLSLQVSDVALTTAGFRDEYYALRDACRESAAGPQLVTVGMIRPFVSAWGVRTSRIGGRSWEKPVVDLEALERASPRVSRWVAARLKPKVLLATQSRVAEAFADVDGGCVPMTPVISVEPMLGWERRVDPADEHEVDLWWLVAALGSPVVSAFALRENLGTGLSAESLRWSAKGVGQVPLPSDLGSWSKGAEAARLLSECCTGERAGLLRALGEHMCAAYGLPDERALVEWWLPRAERA